MGTIVSFVLVDPSDSLMAGSFFQALFVWWVGFPIIELRLEQPAAPPSPSLIPQSEVRRWVKRFGASFITF